MTLIKSVFLVLCGILLASAIFLSFAEDISVEDIKKADNPDFEAGPYKERLPVYMISYADGHEVFFRNQNTLVKSALNKGIDYFLNYRRSLLDHEFYEKNREILEKKKGAGCWLWKPYVILKTLEKMPENAVLIYVDSGFSFKASAHPLIEKAQKYDVVLVEYEKDPYGTVRTIASKEILELMDCETTKCAENPHIWAGLMAFRNTPHARKIVQEWLGYCSNPKIILGERDGRPQDPDYQKHMDDETVLSVLQAKYAGDENIDKYPKERVLEMVVWHHRHPDQLNTPIWLINILREVRQLQRKLLGQKDS